VKLLFAGATGLVGSHALPLLLARGHGVLSLGRRSTGVRHAALGEVETDFRAIPPLPPSDVAICTLGTTIAKAGSQAAFAAIDHDAVLAFARAAQAAGCDQFICVTAVGANPQAAAFYSRVKGEVERDLADLGADPGADPGFARLDLLQPGLILGQRQERRPVERMMQAIAPIMNPILPSSLDRYSAIPAETIAGAIAALVGRGEGQSGQGVHRHDNRAMRNLYKT
jgi:uncharacterized protein YbjT (DUF2867 family)